MQISYDLQNFGRRVRTAREWTGLSQSKFSEKCGIKQSSLSHVEQGLHAPGIEFLHRIQVSYPEIDIGWLLNGNGEMLTAPNLGSLKPEKGESEDELIRELHELRLIAQRGSQAGAWKVLVALNEAGVAVRRAELASRLQLSLEDIVADLALLRRAGLVAEGEHGVTALKPQLRSSNSADVAQQALEAVQTILRDVVPAAERADGSGGILVIEALGPEGSGLDLLRSVRDFVRKRMEAESEGPERVRVVIAINKE